MNIVIAPDSFKNSLSARTVAGKIANGVLKIMPEANISKIPVSDGGEGLLEALVTPLKGKMISMNVKDPLLRNIKANYGIVDNGKTAVIEMAEASGYQLLKAIERNPSVTSTYGTGQLIKAALDEGCKKLIIGLGGSATNDGGMGMLKALGAKFVNKNGKCIGEGGGALKNLHQIDLTDFDKRLLNCEIIAACDVSNPLIGKQGASLVFGSQKGGSQDVLKQLDKNLLHYAYVVKTDTGKDFISHDGSGAAGGTGFALLAFLNAKLIPGISLILDKLELEKKIKDADLVFTGEGEIDQQSLNGKTISGVAKIAKQYNVPLIAIAGKIDCENQTLYKHGITAAFSIINQPMKLEESINKTGDLIEICVMNIMKVVSAYRDNVNNH